MSPNRLYIVFNIKRNKKEQIRMGFESFPSFSLMDDQENVRKLEDFRGRWLVVYFYPRDNTSGCTREARDFTSKLEEFHNLGAEVIGVSTQSTRSHRNFKEKHGLKHILLSDEKGRLAEKLGILKETGTAKRTTYLVDPKGNIVKIWKNVKVKGHADEVLEYLKKEKK